MSDGAQYVTRDGLLYDGGKRAADAEWLAAISTWRRSAECLSNLGDIERASDNPAPCHGCTPLRALVARALASSSAPRPPRES